MDLTEAQWNLVEPRLPQDPVRPDGRGRPWSDRRQVLNGGLWLVRTGAPWQALPDRYGPHQTVHRRFQNWVRAGGIKNILLALAAPLKEAGAWTSQSVLWTAHSFRPKKGASGRENPAGQGPPGHGPCRRRGAASRPAGRKRSAG